MSRADMIVVAGIEIRQDEQGRFRLNDLHAAAGGKRKHQPAQFLRLDQTRALVEEIQYADSHTAIHTVNGGPLRGTYVAKEVVYAYAMWISPSFNLKVIRAYDEMVRVELDRLNGLHFRAVRAELEFLTGVQNASRCGLGLRRWRDDKPELEDRLKKLSIELQPGLFGAGVAA